MDGGQKMDITSPLITQHSTSHLSSTCRFTPTCWYHYWCFPHPLSLSYRPLPSKKKLNGRWEGRRWKEYNAVLIELLHFNQLSPLLSSPSFIILSLSIIPHSLTRSLPPLCGCLFRLGWDKWERMNTLGAWGSRRAECEGQGEERGGRGVTWTCRDWLVRKIKPGRWWRVMNGHHYEWLAERWAHWDIWEK